MAAHKMLVALMLIGLAMPSLALGIDEPAEKPVEKAAENGWAGYVRLWNNCGCQMHVTVDTWAYGGWHRWSQQVIKSDTYFPAVYCHDRNGYGQFHMTGSCTTMSRWYRFDYNGQTIRLCDHDDWVMNEVPIGTGELYQSEKASLRGKTW